MAEYTIGELARLVGLPVKTIRYYSDIGLLPPARRTGAGYRLYGEPDRARVELVRTLREIGLDLATVQEVLDRQVTLAAALDLQLEAVELRLRELRRTRAVLRAARSRPGGGTGEPDPAYLARLQAVARQSAAERERLVSGFLDRVARDVPIDPRWWERMRAGSMPDLPDEPTPEQLDAWLELTEILADPQFQRRLREMGQRFWSQVTPDHDVTRYMAHSEQTVERVQAARAAGIAPTDPAAAPLVEQFVVGAARAMGREPDERFRAELLDGFDQHDPRAARYWELLAVINNRPSPEPTTAAYAWLHRALAHLRRSGRD